MNKPNILLINVDHWPGTLLGAAGHEHILTPTLNILADAGIRYSRAYSATPTCIPARRELMTGTSARTHGDRIFKETLPMKDELPAMARIFTQAGYQTYAVGKLHVYPQRDRIGFNDALINEEGRHHLGGGRDDFELFLEREGYPGQELTHAMGTNHYCARPWHLPEYCHPTNWTTREMYRQIQRRDPGKPGFWYCSYIAPHPPLTPPEAYMRLYEQMDVDMPVVGSWAEDFDLLPCALKFHRSLFPPMSQNEIELARKAFYAQCTYVDHQIRLLIGTLREEGLLDNTIICFTSDHGDMLGNHTLWAKAVMFENAANIPLILSVPPSLKPELKQGVTDDRLAALRNILPTLLDLCGSPVPESVEGCSLISETRRNYLLGEHWEDENSIRMVVNDRYKLIWYPVGNRFQLFDVIGDPMETNNLAGKPEYAPVKNELTSILIQNLYGSDERWIDEGKLTGEKEPDNPVLRNADRTLRGQRGWR